MIHFREDAVVSVSQFRDLLSACSLRTRRPLDDDESLAGMLRHANLTVTAWAGEDELVGIARSVTDFSYCCYLSDLAVAEPYQHQGIGIELIRRTRKRLGPRCNLILLSAPEAVDYYPRLGFDPHPSAWILRPEQPLWQED